MSGRATRELAGRVGRHEAVVVAVQDEDRMPQLAPPRDDVEPVEVDRRRPAR